MTTDFHARVFDAVRAIPRGEVRTYGDIAVEVGSPGGGIAVGQALLPLDFDSDVPWWRVVLSDGKVNREDIEHSNPEGVARVRSVLTDEGVTFDNFGRVASIAGHSAPSSSGGGGRKSRQVDTSIPVCRRCYGRHAGFNCPD